MAVAVAGVALNAAFDRPHVEKMIGGHVSVPWGCAMADIPWRRLGFKLGPQEVAGTAKILYRLEKY